MRRLVLGSATALAAAGVLAGLFSITTSDPLAGCLSRYPGRCLAPAAHVCNYEPACVAAAKVACDERTAVRCPAIVTVRP